MDAAILQIIELACRYNAADLLRHTRLILPHKVGSWPAWIILKTEDRKKHPHWRIYTQTPARLCCNNMGKNHCKSRLQHQVVEKSSENYFLRRNQQRIQRPRQTTFPASMTSQSDLLLWNRGLIWSRFSVMADENIVFLERENCMLAVFNLIFFNIDEYFRPWAIERLPFVPKKRFSRMKFQMERFNPVKIFLNKRNTFEGIPLFSFRPKWPG